MTTGLGSGEGLLLRLGTCPVKKQSQGAEWPRALQVMELGDGGLIYAVKSPYIFGPDDDLLCLL